MERIGFVPTGLQPQTSRRPFHLDYPCLLENHKRFGTSRLVLTHLGKEVLARQNEIELELATDGLKVQL